jgi:tetratricopeptide (TPR) repeat protein
MPRNLSQSSLTPRTPRSSRIKPSPSEQVSDPRTKQALLCKTRVLVGLASVHRSRYEFDKAEELLCAAVYIHQNTFSDAHAGVLRAMSELGDLLAARGDFDAATDTFVSALRKSKVLVGADHVDSIALEVRLGLAMVRKGRLEEADTMLTIARERSRALLGPRHPETLRAMHCHAKALAAKGRLEEAAAILHECLAIRSAAVEQASNRNSLKKIGSKSSAPSLPTGIVVNKSTADGNLNSDNRGVTKGDSNMGNIDQEYAAFAMMEQRAELSSTELTLAQLRHSEGNLDLAHSMLLSCLESCRRDLPPLHPVALRCLLAHASVQEEQGGDKEALATLEECIQGYEQCMCVSHPDARKAIELRDIVRDRLLREET